MSHRNNNAAVIVPLCFATSHDIIYLFTYYNSVFECLLDVVGLEAEVLFPVD